MDARLVKIAAGKGFIIGLTNGGHVLGIDISAVQAPFDLAQWLYVSRYYPLDSSELKTCRCRCSAMLMLFERQRYTRAKELRTQNIWKSHM